MKTYGRFSEISNDFSDFKQKNMGGVNSQQLKICHLTV